MKKIILMMMALTYALLASDAILSIDTGGHTAKINDIIVTKSGDIISASNDKTIRVWSSRDGAGKRKILGQIGAGVEGTIFAIALSPDEQYLAVGGFLDKPGDYPVGQIRLYDYQSGKLLTILTSHTNVVNDLAFSPDGRYLASGSADTTVKLWDISSLRGATTKQSTDGSPQLTLHDDEPTTITFHTNHVYGVKFTNNNTLISSGLDNRIALHSLAGKLLNSYTHNEKLRYIATNGKTIAACGLGKTILLFDMKLNLIKPKIESETVPSGLAYSPDGRYLIAGTETSPINVNIYDSQKNYEKIATFDKHTNLTMAVAFLDNKTAISGGGNNNEIVIWNFGTTTASGAKQSNGSPRQKPRDDGDVIRDDGGVIANEVKQSTKIVGAGQSVWSVGCEGESIAWGNISDYTHHNNRGKLQKSFNLKSLAVGAVIANKVKQSKDATATTSSRSDGDFKRIDSDGLSHSKGGDYGRGDAVLNIESSGVSITKDATTGYRHRCYGWYKDYIVSGGGNGHLKIYDTSGAEIASLVGHTGEIWSIALDGDRLVSGSDDQTIKVWDLKQLKPKTIQTKSHEDKIPEWLKDSFKESNASTAQGVKDKNDTFVTADFVTINPTLSMFVGSDNEWVMWTPEGFFNASKDGAKYIGYHINKGSDKEAEFIGIDAMYDTFYRPDIVSLKLAGEDISKYSTLTIMDALKNLPPKVEVTKLTPKGDGRVNMCYKANSYKNGGIGEVRLYHNGKLFYSDGNYQTANDAELKNKKIEEVTKSALYDGIKRSLKVSSSEQMGASVSSVKGEMVEQCHDTYSVNGDNEYVALAYNKTNTISSELAKANYNQKGSVHKPKLYVVAIGINEFISSKDNLKYAVKDAQDFSKKIKERARTIFEQNDIIEPIVLTDKMATKENITQTIKSLASKVHPEDRVVIFSASHGIVQDGSYYMITHDYKGVIEDGSMIGSNEFVDMTKNLPSFNQLIILDTCHAGGMDKIINGLYDSKIGRLAKKTGMHIYASANSKQEALDGYKENGLFTHTLLKGLDDDSADLRKRGVVSVSDLGEYSKAETNKISKELGTEQTPTIINFGNDIDICKVNGK